MRFLLVTLNTLDMISNPPVSSSSLCDWSDHTSIPSQERASSTKIKSIDSYRKKREAQKAAAPVCVPVKKVISRMDNSTLPHDQGYCFD